MGFEEPPFVGTGRLNPAQHGSSLAPVIAHEPDIPDAEKDRGGQTVDQKEAPHNCL